MAKKKKIMPKKFKLFFYSFWVIFFSGITIFSGIFYAASMGYLGEMPDFRQLENPNTNLATQIISSDNKVLGKFHFGENRIPIQFDDLPKSLVDALIATEDERFYGHSGIDFKGTLRAIVFLGQRGGASTISQQLARQLFVGVRAKNIFQALAQKFKEYVIAVRLERQYTKREIIAMYLNIYDFGYNGDGIKSAANIFFDKELDSLKIEESAVLVGMLKNSSYYNPLRRPELVKNRRNVVLNQMKRNGHLNQQAVDSLKQTTLGINYTPQSHREGLATYFRAYLRNFMKNWSSENLKSDGSKYNINLDGLKIYTTINYEMQGYAEESVKLHMANLQEEFFNQNTPELNPTAPFLDLESEDSIKIFKNAMKRSERWRKMKGTGKSEEEMFEVFQKEVPMSIFSWKGEIDTVMKPIDSIRYYKHFMQVGMMSMEPQTGHVKAWVGGINYKHFQYDHVKQGKRQIGSTFKPFLYATAIDQLKLSPCDSLPDNIYCIEPYKYGNPDP